MNIDEYQIASRRTRRTGIPDKERINNAVLGLAESGEITNLWKKHLYQGHEWSTEEVVSELGDLLFYMAWLADELNVSLSSVAQSNIEKLQKRYPHGFTQQASRERVV